MAGSSAGGYGGKVGDDSKAGLAAPAATTSATTTACNLRQQAQQQQRQQPLDQPQQLQRCQQRMDQQQLVGRLVDDDDEQLEQGELFAKSGSCNVDCNSGASASEDYKLVWRRRQTEHPSTEGSLRALLNKLAPSRVLGCLATQVAGHLVDDEAPDQLARQLVERAQSECLFASTYAKLCSELVRVRSGFMFYKHLMTRCRATFASKVRLLILEAAEPSSSAAAAASAVNQAPKSQTKLYSKNLGPTDVDRHRLNALMVFLCHLFLEGLLSFDQLHQDYLRQLDCQLPDRIALECLCSALKVAGRRLEEQRSHWVLDVIRQAQDAVHGLQQERNLRLTFMVRDLVELHQRNWQQREPQIPSSPIEHAEP